MNDRNLNQNFDLNYLFSLVRPVLLFLISLFNFPDTFLCDQTIFGICLQTFLVNIFRQFPILYNSCLNFILTIFSYNSICLTKYIACNHFPRADILLNLLFVCCFLEMFCLYSSFSMFWLSTQRKYRILFVLTVQGKFKPSSHGEMRKSQND